MQGNLELDIVSGSGAGHEASVFYPLSEPSNYRRDSQSTVAGPPSCASVALRRRLLVSQLCVVDDFFRIQSINKTSIAPISSADLAQRRTNP